MYLTVFRFQTMLSQRYRMWDCVCETSAFAALRFLTCFTMGGGAAVEHTFQ